MRKFVIILLRIPFVLLAVSIIVGVVKEPTVEGIFVVLGSSLLCIAIWNILGLLNGPSETFNERFNESNIRIFLLVATVCISTGIYM